MSDRDRRIVLGSISIRTRSRLLRIAHAEHMRLGDLLDEIFCLLMRPEEHPQRLEHLRAALSSRRPTGMAFWWNGRWRSNKPGGGL